MMHKATVGKIAAYMEAMAPLNWAESWDNVGLQVGAPAQPVERVLVALEATSEVVEEAIAARADLLVVHHPAIFRPLKSLRFDTASGMRLQRLIQAGIALYAAHTNLDVAPGGTNDTLAALAGLKRSDVLMPAGEERYVKLVVFVPRGHEDSVREALAGAGAGHIGNYGHCTFQTAGTGTFLPLKGAKPFLGEQGRLERAEELRLETILPESRAAAAVQAMMAAHPYEEVAYDLYPLANPGEVRGHGRVGQLEQPTTVGEMVGHLKKELGLPHVAVIGDPARQVRTVAVSAGAGAMVIPLCGQRGVDLLITGDVKYHDAQDALDAGLAVVDVGHYNSERIVVPPVARYLRERLAQDSLAVEVLEAKAGRDPFRYT